MVRCTQALLDNFRRDESLVGVLGSSSGSHCRVLGNLGPVESGEDGTVVVTHQDRLRADTAMDKGLAAGGVGVQIDECPEGLKREVQPLLDAPRYVLLALG